MRWDGRMAEHTFSTATAPQRPRKQMPPLWAKTSTSVGAKIEEDVVIHFLQEGPRLRRARTAVGRHGAREQHEKGRTPLHHSKIRTVFSRLISGNHITSPPTMGKESLPNDDFER